jgi:hypothetical protein
VLHVSCQALQWFCVITIKVGLTLLIHSVKHYLKDNFRLLRTMTALGPSSSKARQSSYDSGYSRIELKKLKRTVLVQYHICCSNIPCVRVLGYIQERPATRLSSCKELSEGHHHLPANLRPIPDQDKWVIRPYVMGDTAARFSIDAPLVHFE